MFLLFKKCHCHKFILRFICVASLVFVMASATNAEAVSFWLELKHAWYDIFTPSDYYMPVVNEEFDISQKGTTKRFIFNLKYDRSYTAGIMLKKYRDSKDYNKSLSERYKTTLQLEINFYVDNVLTLSKEFRGEPSPFYGLYGDGWILVHYKCPEELPINKNITCEVKIIEPDKYLQEHYGPASFYIAKMSDK